MDHRCEFCDHVFSSKNNLAMHKKTAKYCIAQRGKQSQTHKCVCGKLFTRAYTLKVHSNKCPVKINCDKEDELINLRIFKGEAISKIDTFVSEVDGLKKTNKVMATEIKQFKEEQELAREELEQLTERFMKEVDQLTEENEQLKKENLELKLSLENGKGQIKVYKERPGTVNNTQYINPKLLNIKCETIPPLTLEYVQQEVGQGKYTYENYIRGEKGLVDFIAALISEDEQRSYVCTDAARNKFHRLIETREWKEDNGANFLNKIFDNLKEPATVYYKKIVGMSQTPDERDTGDFLMDKTKKMFFGITSPKSKDRTELFNRIRMEVRKLAAV